MYIPLRIKAISKHRPRYIRELDTFSSYSTHRLNPHKNFDTNKHPQLHLYPHLNA